MLRSERFDDNQDHDGQQHEHRYFIKDAEPLVAARVDAFFELLQERTAGVVIADHQHHQQQLGVHPARHFRAVLHVDQDRAEHHGEHRQPHRKPVQLARHERQALGGGGVGLHRQVDEDARQVEHAGHPADDEENVQRLNPEHSYISFNISIRLASKTSKEGNPRNPEKSPVRCATRAR